ncbi:MAG: hypothetical protein ABIP94_08990 [Planctomycetota bacterium]
MPRLSLIPLLSTALLGQQVVEGPEPNQSTATATALSCGREAVGSLANATDADWYRIVLAATADLRLETGPLQIGLGGGLGGGIEVGDAILTLLDASGAPLQGNGDGVRAGYYSRLLARALPVGVYYVAVEAGPFANVPGSYTLDVRCTPPVAAPTPPVFGEGSENNDPRTGGTATTIGLPARCNGVLSTTGNGGDWDFYRVLLLQDSFLQVRVNATANHPSPPVNDDPVLYLFDASTPPVLLAGPFHASELGVWDAAIDVRLPAGLYQIAIRGWAGSVAGRYYLDVFRSDAARVAVHPGGCSGRQLGIALTGVGPGAPQGLERPTIGTSYTMTGSGLGGNAIVLHVVGFLPTLIDLTPFGAIGCFVHVAWLDTILLFSDAQGNAAITVPLPENASLLGATLESQLAVLDFSNPLGLTTSNSVSAVLGN